MNKHVKLFYKNYERSQKDPKYKKYFEKSLFRIITEFRYKHDVENDRLTMTEDYMLKLHEHGIELSIEDIVTDLELDVKREILYDYIDHKLKANEVRLKALSYKEYLKIKGINYESNS